MNFAIDLAHRGVSVAQWWSIGVRNRRSEVRFLIETQNFFLCPTLMTRRKTCFSKINLDIEIFIEFVLRFQIALF